MDRTDAELLSDFVKRHDEAAFTELVNGRIDFVYAAALRQLRGDSHRAEDITQEVFVRLARHAATVARHPSVLGWLYVTTRNVVTDAIRRELRRQSREQEAYAMQQKNPEVDWTRLQPVLDEALMTLNDTDRAVVLARYFDNQAFAEIGAALGFSENAAQRRGTRALDKLRIALARQQVASTSAALGAVLASYPAVAAPAALVARTTQAALATAIAPAGILAGVGLITAMSSKTFWVLATGVALGLGSAVVATRARQSADSDLASATQRNTALAARVNTREKQARNLAARTAELEQANAKLLASAHELQADPHASVAVEPAGVINSDMVRRRFKHAQELVENGDPGEALRELIWCYDVGMPRISGMLGVRITSLDLFADLGKRYAPALDALRERHARAEQAARASVDNIEPLMEYGRINSLLGRDAETIAFYDSLPADDPRRMTLASMAQDALIEAQRYQDAASGRGYGGISSSFDSMVESIERSSRSNRPNSGDAEQAKKLLVSSTMRHIEMFAGIGDLEHARLLAQRLLAIDGGAETRAQIQQHAARAGHPELLETLASPSR